jgi:hypothetical protein
MTDDLELLGLSPDLVREFSVMLRQAGTPAILIGYIFGLSHQDLVRLEDGHDDVWQGKDTPAYQQRVIDRFEDLISKQQRQLRERFSHPHGGRPVLVLHMTDLDGNPLPAPTARWSDAGDNPAD